MTQSSTTKKDTLAPLYTRRVGTSLMRSHLMTAASPDCQPGVVLVTAASPDSQPGILLVHMAMERKIGCWHPTTHPNQLRVSHLINDNYCIAADCMT